MERNRQSQPLPSTCRALCLLCVGLFLLPACGGGSGDSESATSVTTVEVNNGVTSTTVSAGAAATIEVSEGENQGVTLDIPPGTLVIDSNISVQPGVDVADDLLASELEIGDEGGLTGAGSSVLVSSDTETDPAQPMVLEIPLPTSLKISTSNYVVVYKVWRRATDSIHTGVIPTSSLTIGAQSVSVSINYFGIYQLATTAAEISEEKSATTTIPILSKNAAEELSTFTLAKPTGTYTTLSHTVAFSTTATEGIEIDRCGVFMDRDKSAPWDLVTLIDATPSHSATSPVTGAYDTFGRFICRDTNGRTSNSGWSDALSVAAGSFANSLATFTAVTGNITGTIDLTYSLPSDSSNYSQLRVERTSGSTPGACNTGTVIIAATSSIPSSSAYTDAPGSGTWSYRACILSSTGQLTDSNTVSAVQASASYVAFLTSLAIDGDLTVAVGSQTFSSGIEGADYRCQYLAEQENLAGTWKAIISDSSADVRDRISVTGIVYDVLGNQLVDTGSSSIWTLSAAASTGCSGTPSVLTSAINYDESGTNPGAVGAWTGSTQSGVASSHCNDWSSSSSGNNGTYALTNCTAAGWVESNTGGCNTSTGRLLCISQ